MQLAKAKELQAANDEHPDVTLRDPPSEGERIGCMPSNRQHVLRLGHIMDPTGRIHERPLGPTHATGQLANQGYYWLLACA